MKKLIILLIFILLISGCTRNNKDITTEEYLLQVIENHKNASTMTIEADGKINLGQNNASLPIPLKASVMLDNKGNDDFKDDLAYCKTSISLVLMSFNIEGWYQDKTIYLKAGDDKRIFDIPDYQYREIDPKKVLEIIQNNCENIHMENKLSGTSITLTPRSDLLRLLMKELNMPTLPSVHGFDLNSALDSIKLNDVVIIVDNKGYISRINASGSFTFSTYNVNGEIQLKIKDINNTNIPSFNIYNF